LGRGELGRRGFVERAVQVLEIGRAGTLLRTFVARRDRSIEHGAFGRLAGGLASTTLLSTQALKM